MRSTDHVVVVGAGIIGLSSAYFLRKAGYAVTVLDRGDMLDNCSYGNAGYLSPSHFVPLAAPGVLKMGLRWMMDSKSPFYIAPRLDRNLLAWGWQFLRHANAGHVARSAPALRDILLLSKAEYAAWAALPDFDFAYNACGMMELFQSEKMARHAQAIVDEALALGLDARALDAAQAQAMEPHVRMRALAGVYFADDVQVYPQKLMAQLLKRLPEMGVVMRPHHAVKDLRVEKQRVRGIVCAQGQIDCDHVVLSAGVWSPEVARPLGLRFVLVGGRGYSLTFSPAPWRFMHSVVLEDARVAISPMDGDKLRFGGTMEITKPGSKPKLQRMQGILEGVRRFFPEIDVPMPAPAQIWHGYRPVSKDGLPFIGKAPGWENVVVATGHAMLGLSMGAGTGRLVKELVANEPTAMDLKAFAVGR